MAGSYPAWAHSVQEVADHYQVDLQDGLTDAQVSSARERFGRNELGEAAWQGLVEACA